jgi:hypothetical protein
MFPTLDVLHTQKKSIVLISLFAFSLLIRVIIIVLPVSASFSANASSNEITQNVNLIYFFNEKFSLLFFCSLLCELFTVFLFAFCCFSFVCRISLKSHDLYERKPCDIVENEEISNSLNLKHFH